MEGWQCPICKKVYSPFVTSCFYCGENNVKTSTGTDYPTKSVAVIHPQEQIDRGFDRGSFIKQRGDK